MTVPHLADRPTAVYRLFATDGALLYVGITYDPKVRLSSHRIRKPWWPEAHDAELEWFDSRTLARHQESKAIAWESPRHNVSRPQVRGGRPSTTGIPHGSSEATSYAGVAVRGLRRPVVPEDFDVFRAAWASCHTRCSHAAA